MMNKKLPLLSALSALLLTACGASDLFSSQEEIPLPGERISVMELQKSLEPDDPEMLEQGLIMPTEWKNEFWPQAGGYPNHAMQNLWLSPDPLQKFWNANIGQGTTDELPLTAQPIIADGRAFTLNTNAEVMAFDIQNGKKFWERDIKDKTEDDPVVGGGLAFADGILFATNGFSEILALNPNDGAIIWRSTIAGPARAAPTVMNGRIFVTTLDSRLIALDVNNGAVMWEYQGIAETSGLVGAASPAANNDVVIPAFSSGELSAIRVENGSVAWSENLAAVRGFGGLSSLSDIKALPVMDKGIVLAISFSGRLVAIDERTGTRIWQREISGTQTPWVAGNHVFVLSSENKLIALARDTGAIQWVTELPRYEDDELIILNGPVLAGGRLVIAGTDGRVFEVSPEKGEIIRQSRIGETIAMPPVVAGGVIYFLTENGTLSAYR